VETDAVLVVFWKWSEMVLMWRRWHIFTQVKCLASSRSNAKHCCDTETLLLLIIQNKNCMILNWRLCTLPSHIYWMYTNVNKVHDKIYSMLFAQQYVYLFITHQLRWDHYYCIAPFSGISWAVDSNRIALSRDHTQYLTDYFLSSTNQHRLTRKIQEGSHSFTDKKSSTFQDSTKNFPRSLQSLRMFKYKEKLAFTCNVYGMPKVAKFISTPQCISVNNSKHKLSAALLLLAFDVNH